MSNTLCRYDTSFFAKSAESGSDSYHGPAYTITPQIVRWYYDGIDHEGNMTACGPASLMIGGAMISQANAVFGLLHGELFGTSQRIPVYLHQDLALEPGAELRMDGTYNPVLRVARGYDGSGKSVELQTDILEGDKIIARGTAKLFLPKAGGGVKAQRVTALTDQGNYTRDWDQLDHAQILTQAHINWFSETGDDQALHVGVNSNVNHPAIRESFFGGTISHGMNPLGRAVAAASLLGYEDTELLGLSADFVLPLYPGYKVQAGVLVPDQPETPGRVNVDYAVYERTYHNALVKGCLTFAE